LACPVQLPMTAWVFVRGVKDGPFKKGIGCLLTNNSRSR
jgi:hypothetical protein